MSIKRDVAVPMPAVATASPLAAVLPAAGASRIAVGLVLSMAFTLLTVVGANIVIPISPVPITMQTLFVLLAGASIGARAVCVAPVSIGRWALVAAGAVVVRDVPDHALVAGVPARQLGWVGRAGVPLEERGEEWWCPRTGERYAENGTGLVLMQGVEPALAPEPGACTSRTSTTTSSR